MKKILSVIILTHNQPGELARLLGRLTTVPNEVEIIVVDDHSSDTCMEDAAEAVRLFRKLTGAGRYEYLDEWAGCGGARNHGAKVAQGDWVWFVDGDDLIAADAPQRIVKAIKTIDGDQWVSDVLLLDYDMIRPDGSVETTNFDGWRLKPWEVGIMAWSKVIRRSALVPFRERIMYEDNDWWMRQVLTIRNKHNPVVAGGACYTYHQLASGSATSIIEQLKIPDGSDPASIRTLESFLADHDPKLTEAIAWLMEDLAALLKVRIDAVDSNMPGSYFDSLDYMIKYFMKLLRIK